MKKILIILIVSILNADLLHYFKLKGLQKGEFAPLYKDANVSSPIILKIESNSFLLSKNRSKIDKQLKLKWQKVEFNNSIGWILESFLLSDNKIAGSKINNKNSIATNIIKLAKSKLKTPYKYATIGPNSFDCSGFVYWVYKENNITLPRTSLSQSKISKPLKKEQLKAGDLVFFDTNNKKHVNHSGIYLGKNRFIHASSGKAYSVTISPIDKGFYKKNFLFGENLNDILTNSTLR